MNIDFVLKQLNEGHEIEFVYQGKRYSITQGKVDGKAEYFPKVKMLTYITNTKNI